jgi:3-oxoacyl-[acyl-carrier-protein] synthase II
VNVVKTRIAVTGMGCVTPLGMSLSETWQGLLEGWSGIGEIHRFDASGLPCRIAGELPASPLEILFAEGGGGISRKTFARLDPFSLFALHACHEAFREAGLDRCDWDNSRAGVVIGSSRGGISTLEKNRTAFERKGYKGFSPFLTVSSLINQASASISRRYGITGPSLAVSTACSSGLYAVMEAVRMLRSGEVDWVITGGAEAPVTPLMIGGFARAGVLSRRNDDPPGACRPFDRDRDGFVISEGAGILILERWEYARSRRVEILGEILGCGASTDLYHMTTPDPTGGGMARAMCLALQEAGLGPDEIDLISAHGTGTPSNDRTESRALHLVLGPRAGEIPLCAVKSMTGHMLGASGAVELILSVLSARTGKIPAIRNLERPDADCDLHLVRGCVLEEKVSTVLTNSFAFGGADGTLVVRGTLSSSS